MDEDPNATPGKFSSEPASALPFVLLALIVGCLLMSYFLFERVTAPT
jgi:hypothetical protein